MIRPAAVIGLALIAGCAYLNGVYNARQAEKRGDRHARAGRATQAVAAYESTATQAETLLVQQVGTDWVHEARYLAGRGWALSGHCDRAIPHLELILRPEGLSGERRERATLALGICRISGGKEIAEGRAMLAPLVRARDRALARQAALWAARASLALDQSDSARAYFQIIGNGASDWELVAHHVARNELAAAESALVRRVRANDDSPRLEPALLELWARGARRGVERVIDVADSSRLSPPRLGRLHIAVGDLWLEGASDSAASVHFERAARVSRDTLVSREAAARRATLAVRAATTLAEAEATVAGVRNRARGTELLRRLEDNLLLIKLLERRNDASEAGMFLAAEVARDSLRAPALARSMFRRIGESGARSPFAAKALLAAAALSGDSSDVLIEMARERFPRSPYTALAVRNDRGMRDSVAVLDGAMGELWVSVTKAWTDSVAQLRRDPRAPVTPPSTTSTTSTTSSPPARP